MTKDEIESKRLLKVYGITLEEYYVLRDSHCGGCHICGAPPVTRKLNVDHNHRFARAKITAFKADGRWVAFCDNGRYAASAGRRQDATASVRQNLKRASVRGLLCFRCNKGLQHFSDHPERLRRAADYLQRFQDLHIKEITKCQQQLAPPLGPLLPQPPAPTPTLSS